MAEAETIALHVESVTLAIKNSRADTLGKAIGYSMLWPCVKYCHVIWKGGRCYMERWTDKRTAGRENSAYKSLRMGGLESEIETVTTNKLG